MPIYGLKTISCLLKIAASPIDSSKELNTAMDYVISDGDGLQLRVHSNNHRRHRRDDQLVEAVLALPKTRPR